MVVCAFLANAHLFIMIIQFIRLLLFFNWSGATFKLNLLAVVGCSSLACHVQSPAR